VAQSIMYLICGTCKDQNRRVFENPVVLPDTVVALKREEIAQRAYAHTHDRDDG
jgi:hypothetical protein